MSIFGEDIDIKLVFCAFYAAVLLGLGYLFVRLFITGSELEKNQGVEKNGAKVFGVLI